MSTDLQRSMIHHVYETNDRSSLETVLGVPRTLNFADIGYFIVAISRPSLVHEKSLSTSLTMGKTKLECLFALTNFLQSSLIFAVNVKIQHVF
jgi:hypothetical protein